MRRHTLLLVSTAALIVGPLAIPAQAYVDPGTGSFIFQAVIGGALAAGVALKVFWRKIAGVFSRRDDGAENE